MIATRFSSLHAINTSILTEEENKEFIQLVRDAKKAVTAIPVSDDFVRVVHVKDQKRRAQSFITGLAALLQRITSDLDVKQSPTNIEGVYAKEESEEADLFPMPDAVSLVGLLKTQEKKLPRPD